MRRPRKTVRTGQYVALALYLIFLGFPLLWLLSISLKTPRELASISPHLIPHHFQWSNYSDAFDAQGLLRSAGASPSRSRAAVPGSTPSRPTAGP